MAQGTLHDCAVDTGRMAQGILRDRAAGTEPVVLAKQLYMGLGSIPAVQVMALLRRYSAGEAVQVTVLLSGCTVGQEVVPEMEPLSNCAAEQAVLVRLRVTVAGNFLEAMESVCACATHVSRVCRHP